MFSVIIPARYGSTRLPAKPLRQLAGKPLLEHVYRCAERSGAEEVIIATDDERIQKVAEDFGATVCMTSPDCPTGTDRLAEVVSLREYADDRIVVNLQGDEPLMPAEVIRQVAENLAARPEASVATVYMAVQTADELFDPNVVKLVTDAEGYAMYFSRAPIPWARDSFAQNRDVLPDGPFNRHIGLYAYRVGFLRRFVQWPACPTEKIESLEQLRVLWHGEKIHAAEAVAQPGPGVDTEEDLAQVERILARD